MVIATLSQALELQEFDKVSSNVPKYLVLKKQMIITLILRKISAIILYFNLGQGKRQSANPWCSAFYIFTGKTRQNC